MSRSRWQSNCASLPVKDWRVAFAHTPLEGRTTDPEALDWDEAEEIFHSGLYAGRRGDLATGRAKIATAFLLDGRSINYSPILPDPEAADTVMDGELLLKLVMSDVNSTASQVLRIMAAGRHSVARGEGQEMVGDAMVAIEQLLKLIEQHPQLEKSPEEGGVLGGCLTRPNLLYHRSTLHMSMGNHRLAVRDLTSALKIDPSYTKARDARASLYASLKLKDMKEIHFEYQRLVGEVHEDNRGNEVSYAWLAITTMSDTRLGTFEEAKHYYEMSLRASLRRTELYGPHRSGTEPPAVQLMKKKWAMMKSDPSVETFRRDLDSSKVNIPDGFATMESPELDRKLLRHLCLYCGKSAPEAGITTLKKCSRCKKVHYCSKNCQTSDWKEHKGFCKYVSSIEVEKMSFTPPTGGSKV